MSYYINLKKRNIDFSVVHLLLHKTETKKIVNFLKISRMSWLCEQSREQDTEYIQPQTITLSARASV